jgi:hypothetical protein
MQPFCLSLHLSFIAYQKSPKFNQNSEKYLQFIPQHHHSNPHTNCYGSLPDAAFKEVIPEIFRILLNN